MHAAASQPEARWRVAIQLEALTRLIGRTLAWLTLAMALAMAVVVFQRYWLGTGSIRLQESIRFMHAAVFLLAAAYTLADWRSCARRYFLRRDVAAAQSLGRSRRHRCSCCCRSACF